VSIQPVLKEKAATSYAGFRIRLNRSQLDQAVPDAVLRLGRYFAEHELAACGPALVRYFVVDYTNGDVDIDVGLPIELSALPADERIHFAQLPSGTYATALHRGPYESLLDTTGALLEWAKRSRAVWRVSNEGDVTWWASRVEHYLAAPPEHPDPFRWLTEVAILLRTPASVWPAPLNTAVGAENQPRGPTRWPRTRPSPPAPA
jgi:hypothetical protein